MDSYTTSLLILISLLIISSWWHHKGTSEKLALVPEDEADRFNIIDEEIHDLDHDTTADKYFDFRNQFLFVYGLVMAADWLQGSFMYSLYKNTYQIAEPTIAALFATGFICAGISATIVGSFIDTFGRKLSCQSYCVLYSLSCLTCMSDKVWLLFLGRALGGVSTTILFTAFETWMLAEYNKQEFGHSDSALSAIYGSMAILNGFIAIGSGLVAHMAVTLSDSETTPFLISVACLAFAFAVISRDWAENYGSPTTSSATITPPTGVLFDKTLLAIATTSCIFEGTMYYMVFSWSQAIIDAREIAGRWGNIPFGIIFANLMAALTLGSFFFTYLSRVGNSVKLSSYIIQLTLSVSAVSLLLPVVLKGEMKRFLAFCAFEFCVGIYFPSMAFLKAAIVNKEQRGKVYGLMRVPVNVFVVLCLGTVKEGNRNREDRFMMCSGLLLLSVVFMFLYVPRSKQFLNP
ncbi:hypothetical protein S40288_08706 [Stachybotrys chartarum IBT 40288]|nr:hypothetical protein S40288_08706 [Stachybotrys chartarum IBT 40288]